jgi:hypothetical protein
MDGWRRTETRGRGGERLLARAAAHVTEAKRQGEETGLRHGVKGYVSRSLAKAQVRWWSTDLEKRCPRFARHLFDEMTRQEQCPARCSEGQPWLGIVSGRFLVHDSSMECSHLAPRANVWCEAWSCPRQHTCSQLWGCV